MIFLNLNNQKHILTRKILRALMNNLMSLYLQVTMSSSVPCQTCWAKCPRDKAGGMSTKGVLPWKTA